MTSCECDPPDIVYLDNLDPLTGTHYETADPYCGTCGGEIDFTRGADDPSPVDTDWDARGMYWV
jgi:hypothetical protein